MKVGILTFHSQLNYGGVLQCLALQQVAGRLGYEVVVVDRWLSVDNLRAVQAHGKRKIQQWAKFWLRAILGCGDIYHWVRVKRTREFLAKYLNLTSYHFVDWATAPKKLDIDVLVVGSDQVWHCGDLSDPSVYLLEGAPPLRAISYAASFGVTYIPETFIKLYRRGLSRFSAISCRESQGVEICNRLGFYATHVVDPTLLAWCDGAESRAKETKHNELVCYFLSEKLNAHMAILDSFSKRTGCTVKIFMNTAWTLPFPSSIVNIKSIWNAWKCRFSSRIEIMDSAGPAEFAGAFKSAKWVLSDSYHALMFSVINGCNARILKPTTDYRRNMFSRIEEFAARTAGSLIVDSVTEALDSFAKGEKVLYDYNWIEGRCRESEEWLKNNLI